MKQSNQFTSDRWRNSTNPFRHRLIELRKNCNLSAEELSELLQIHRTDMLQYEAGTKEPSIHQLKKMAKFFSVTVDQLIGFKLE